MAVRTLLHLCRTPVGLAELQAQPSVLAVAGSPDAVYPFTAGVSRDSNLPNLLAAAKDLAVPLGDINAYLDAVEAGDPNLRTLERDRSRRASHGRRIATTRAGRSGQEGLIGFQAPR